MYMIVSKENIYFSSFKNSIVKMFVSKKTNDLVCDDFSFCFYFYFSLFFSHQHTMK